MQQDWINCLTEELLAAAPRRLVALMLPSDTFYTPHEVAACGFSGLYRSQMFAVVKTSTGDEVYVPVRVPDSSGVSEIEYFDAMESAPDADADNTAIYRRWLELYRATMKGVQRERED